MWTAEGVQASVVLSPQSLIHTSLQRLMTVVREERSLFYWIGVYSCLSVAVCIIGVAKYGKLFGIEPLSETLIKYCSIGLYCFIEGFQGPV